MEFICPKNYKAGKYIVSKYRKIDLLILGASGVFGVMVLISFSSMSSSLKSVNLGIIGLILSGIIISVGILLTMKIPYYHNVLEWILTLIKFFTKIKKYEWKGINYYEGE